MNITKRIVFVVAVVFAVISIMAFYSSFLPSVDSLLPSPALYVVLLLNVNYGS